MADRPVERREEPLVRRREGDDMPPRPEPGGGAGDLGRVVLDVLQDVDIEQRVELGLGRAGRPGCRPRPRSTRGADASRIASPSRAARPASGSRQSHRRWSPGRGAGSSRRARRRPPGRRVRGTARPGDGGTISMRGGGEQVEFVADVGVVRHGGSHGGHRSGRLRPRLGTPAGEDIRCTLGRAEPSTGWGHPDDS